MTVVIIQYALVILGGYLLGSIPFGYVAGRIKRIDVRDYCSGRAGGTIVL